MGQGTGLRSSFTQVSYDHVSPISPRLFLFICLDQLKKKNPTSQNRECFPLELEANTLDGFNICWTMRGWVVGTSHSFVTNTCAYSVSDYKSKNKESLKPPCSSPPAMKIGLSLYLFKLKMSIGKENADIPGIQVKISPSSKGGLSIEHKLIHCLSPIRTHKPSHAHMLLFLLDTKTSQSKTITVTFTSVIGLI